jgi:hypothetical protein
MRLVEAPGLTPGHCYLCHSGHASPSVDTMRDDGIWRVYLCERCVGEGARLFDWISPEEGTDLRKELADANKQVDELVGRIANAETEFRTRIAAEVAGPAKSRDMVGIALDATLGKAS